MHVSQPQWFGSELGEAEFGEPVLTRVANTLVHATMFSETTGNKNLSAHLQPKRLEKKLKWVQVALTLVSNLTSSQNGHHEIP